VFTKHPSIDVLFHEWREWILNIVITAVYQCHYGLGDKTNFWKIGNQESRISNRKNNT